jgi:hypothetical protein
MMIRAISYVFLAIVLALLVHLPHPAQVAQLIELQMVLTVHVLVLSIKIVKI